MKHLIYLVFFVGILFGCNSEQPANQNGNAVSGAFTIYSDEAFKPLMQTLADSYMAQYTSVKINMVYGSGSDEMKNFVSGNYEAFVTSYLLKPQDSALLASNEVFYKSFHFASDAIAVIRNKQNKDTVLDISENIKWLCSDTTASTKRIICTDSVSTDNTRSMLEKINYTSSCIGSWFACGSNIKVVDYISTNNNATGFLSYCYISDSDDPEMMKIKNSISVVKLKNDTSTTGTFYSPTQSSISTGDYPLVRKINLITVEPYAGPATGFAAYVASQEGQQVIRLLGLVPAKMPTREVIIKQY